MCPLLTNIIFLILGGLLGIIVTAFISSSQFDKSQSNYRLQRVINATEKAVFEYLNGDKNMGPIRSNFRYSFGVVIDNLISTYGISQPRGVLPMANKHPILVNSEGDTWGLYNEYVRPVISDLNNHNIFGIMFRFQKFSKLKSLLKLCDQIEIVIGNIDSIRELERNHSKILSFENAMEIIPSEDNRIKPHLFNINNELDRLNEYWQKWIELNS